MLLLAHLFLNASHKHSGLLFVTVSIVQASSPPRDWWLIRHHLAQLPSPCMQNSRYLTPSHFEGLMKRVGFEMIKERRRVGGKMGYWLFRKVNPAGLEKSAYERKSVLRSGKARNNFAILL